MEIFGDVVLIGLGISLIFFNENIGTAIQALNQSFWTEAALPLKSVYRGISCVIGTAMLIAGVNDFWFHSWKSY
jgi:hypothetical protein